MSSPEVIDAQFDRAVEIVQSLPKTGPIQTDYEEKLTMYRVCFVSSGIHRVTVTKDKTATVGNVKTPRPGIWDMLGRAKWDAWAKHRDLDQLEAKWLYVDALLKVLRKYSDKTVAMTLVQELESYGDFTHLSTSRTHYQSGDSDTSGSTTSDDDEPSHPPRNARLRRDSHSDAHDEAADEPRDLPVVIEHERAMSQSQSQRPPSRSSLSSHRYRTPLASVMMSPPPIHNTHPSQPLPDFETPSAFPAPSPVSSPSHPTMSSYVGISGSSHIGAATPPHSHSYTPQYRGPQQPLPPYGGMRNTSEAALERAVENVQVHLAALTERLDSLENIMSLSRSNTSLTPRHIGSPRGRRSPNDSRGSHWDLDDLGMWSLVVKPVARSVENIRMLATFFAKDEDRSPTMIIIRRLCLDVCCQIFVETEWGKKARSELCLACPLAGDTRRTMSISTPTIADILKMSQLENIELMATTQSTAVQTCTQTLTEKKLPLPNSAIHDEQWIDLLVSGLKTTTELSAKTLQYYKIVQNGTFQTMVKAKRYSWKNEEDYRTLFRFLQELAVHCAFDIAREEFSDFFHPGSYPVTESETGPKARADISSVVYLEPMATKGLYLSATELKTILTLPRASLSTAEALSQPRSEWTKPKALYNRRIGAERDQTSVNEKAAIDLLWQNHSQLVLRSVAEEGSDFIVAPLYGIVGNFNEMIIVKRPTKPSEQNTTVVLSGPHKPKELLPRMVAIYADQLRKICSTDVKKLVSWKARADDDEDTDNDHQEPPNKRTKTETKGQTKPSKSTRKSPRNLSSKKSGSAKTGKGKRKYVQAILSSATWPVGTRFRSAATQISYIWEFRLGGNPFIVNNTPTVLPSWPDSPSVVHKISTLKNGDSPCIKLTSIL
ncbi:hypothetical protein H0H93_010340, partial [Arthromyces matolae]